MLPKEAEYAHPRGWPAKPSDAVQRVDDNYVLADMVAKAVNGMPTKRAMEWGRTRCASALKGQLKVGLDRGRRAPRARGGRAAPARPPRAAQGVVGAGARLRLRPDPPRLRPRSSSLVAFPFGMAIYFSLSDYWVGLARAASSGSPTTARSSATRRSARPCRTRSCSPASRSRSRPCSACGWPCSSPATCPLQAAHPGRGAAALRDPDRALARSAGGGCSTRSTAW